MTIAISVTAIVLFIIFIMFLIGPIKPEKGIEEPFLRWNFAHRGLYMKDGPIPENSMLAFMRAVEHGYGIELDIHLSADGEVVVFHDDTLTRMCGIDKNIEDMTYAELSEQKLNGTDCRIPLLTEVLDVVGGRVPIIIEIKRGRRNNLLCAKAYKIIKVYKGRCCIESFDPRIVSWFKKNAKEIFRGQLACPMKDYKGETSRITAFILGNGLTNFVSRPNFISYRIGKKGILIRFAELLGAVKIGWTAHDASAEQDFDAIIFEHFLPQARYVKEEK